MAGAKNVIDMRPGKGFTTSQSNEHLRVFSDKDRAKKAQWNYDPSREHLNFEIGKGGVVMKVNKMKSIPQRIAENLEARGIKDPNLSLINQGKRPYFKTVANFILGGNREVMRNLAFGNQNVNWEQGADNTQLKRMPEIENWAKDAYRFMCKKYGEKNIAAFVVHLDEANPHIHCTVLPITPKEKFSFLGVFLDGHDDKEALSRHMTNLHTEFADEVGIKYGLERGDSIKETGAEHRTTEEYRERLWKEAQQKEAEVEENNKTIEGNKKTIDTQNNIMDSQSREIKHAAARLKALQTMIKNLQTHKLDLEGEVKKLERDLESGKITKEEADRKLAQINADIEKTKEKIADKIEKLKIAQQQLDIIEEKKNKFEAKAAMAEEKATEAEKKYNEVKAKIDKKTPTLNKQVMREMQALGYHLGAIDTQNRLEKYNEFKAQLPNEQREFLDSTVGKIWDGSFMEQIAENTSAVCSVATALFMGYLDSATTIAASHGGGGSPGSGWGKKDDEDDLAFRRRCFGMAMHMMRSGNKQQRKR